jgi:hypothetical protein
MTEMALRSRARESESMGGQDNGLTLQGLAKRLETLERENERMRSENAELRQEVSVLRGSGTRRDEVLALRDSDEHRDQEEPVSEFEGRVSRRSLLSKAGAAAVAAVAAGALVNPREAKADHSDDTVQANQAFLHFIQVLASHVGLRAVEAFNTSDSQGAIHAENSGDGAGVRALGGTGVWGSSSKSGHSGVSGQHTGTSGIGTVGIGKGGDAGVLGRNNTGVGVLGEGRNGVHGTASGGYGGQFEGGRAQLRLVPAGTVGKPTSGTHQKGEIYMDSAGALFVCTATSTATTTAKWRKVTTTAV